MKVLIIEDDKETANNIVKGLSEQGFIAEAYYDGQKGLTAGLTIKFDVMIIDRMLPIIGGLDIIKSLRENDIDTPILMLSALGEIDDKVTGLTNGCDDYMAKPFSFAELIARINILTKRQSKEKIEKSMTVIIGDLYVDKLNREVRRGDKKIHLKPREFTMLAFFADNVEQIVTRDMLLSSVWGYDFDTQTNIVDVHISKLRNKIDKDFNTNSLLTIRGVGYKLTANVDNV